MVVTAAVFQPPMFWSKRHAFWNALAMFDTDATFHLLISALNADGELKRTVHYSRSITLPSL